MSRVDSQARATIAPRVAPSYPDFAADPRSWDTIAGVPAELAQRIPGFAAHGIDPERIVAAIRAHGPERGPATPGWAEGVAATGEEAMEAAEAAERQGDGEAAKRAFLAAAFWFFLARFPHILNPAGAAAHRRHNEAYARAAVHFDPPLEVVSVPLGDASFPAFLRLPRGRARPAPLALIWGGIDVWKSDLDIHYLSEALLARGMATLALDMPGTGASPIPVSPTAERTMRAALDLARGRPEIDGGRIGAYGLSFGGHFAVKLALVEPGLRGVVQVGGPIHHTFAPEHLGLLPFGAKAALARIAGLDPRDGPDRLIAALAPLSLTAQGLLPARAHAPLLSINGEDDTLVPIRDLHYLSEQGVAQDRLTFARDRHVASGNRDLHIAFAADWLARKLDA